MWSVQKDMCVWTGRVFQIAKFSIHQKDDKYAGWYQVPKHRKKETKLAKFTNNAQDVIFRRLTGKKYPGDDKNLDRVPSFPPRGPAQR